MQADGWLELAPGIRVRRERLVWTASRSGGPGGQHANTTDSRVTLHLRLQDLVGGDAGFISRLRRLAGKRVTDQGVLVLSADSQRSQHRNKDILLDRLAEMVEQVRHRPKRRRPTRPTRGSIERRLQGKHLRSQRKARRRPPDDQ